MFRFGLNCSQRIIAIPQTKFGLKKAGLNSWKDSDHICIFIVYISSKAGQYLKIY